MRPLDSVDQATRDPGRIVERYHAGMLVALISLVALALRLYHLDARGLFGDEYNSLLEALQFGRNPQSLVYFGTLHFWMQLVPSDFGVRFLSVLFGVLSVPAAYYFGSRLIDKKTGLILALLIAASPFAIQYSQTVRFYSLFLLATLLSLGSFVSLYKNPQSHAARVIWLVTSLLVIFSHLFGVFVPLLELITFWVAASRGKRRMIYIGLVALFVLGSIALSPLLVNPTTLGIIGRLYASYALPLTGQSRGLSIANVAKVPLTLYFFSLGESAYPFALPFSVVGGIVFTAASIIGVLRLRRHAFVLLLLLVEMLPLAMIYLALDPAAPAFSDTAAPRHVMMVLPPFLTLVSVGIGGTRHQWLGAIGFGAILFYSLSSYYVGNWNYSLPPNVDLHRIANRIQAESDKQTVVVYDGRSAESLNRYLQFSPQKESYWNLLESDRLTALDTRRVILLLDNSHFQHSASFDQFIRLLEHDYEFRSGQVTYPYFNYVFDRKSALDPYGYTVDSSGQVVLPKEIYGLEFQDLILPARTTFKGSDYQITGSLTLPGTDSSRERTIPLARFPAAGNIVLLSNVTGASRLRQGQVIGEIALRQVDGSTQVFPLRLGIESQDWSRDCDPPWSCSAVLSWHKLFALVGQYGYEGAWADFQARIFGVKMPIRESRIESITIRYTENSGEFHLWGMSLQ